MSALSPMHIVLIALVALLLFGPNKLPELGRSVGRMLREFKDASNGNSGNGSEVIHNTKAVKKEITASNEKPSAN